MKHCICILEDDRDIREIVGWILRNKGFEVLAFENVSDFKSGIKHMRPDLFILDIMLPDGNGVEVCKALKTDKNTRQIPVLLMSANATPESLSTSMAEDYIAKPFDIDHFVKKVSQQVS